jgi:D-3-phosphoglycerate dehydrogenase
MFKIRTINKISEEALRAFPCSYNVSPTQSSPDAILVRSSEVNTSTYPNILAVGRAGVGVNNISLQKATDSGVCVFNTPGANANAVAELIFIMLGIVARNIGESLKFTSSLKNELDSTISSMVESKKSKFKGFELEGKTLGVLGLGKIGARVANMGFNQGLRVIAYDPHPTLSNMHLLDSRIKLVNDAGVLFANSDMLTVHVPLNDKTRHLIGKRELRKIKKGCVLLNYARSGVIDDNAAVEAINKRILKYYITDFPTRQLLQQDNIICTPHLGASTAESEKNCSVMIVNQIRDYLEYGNITNSVNFPIMEAPISKSIKTRLIVINKDIPNMIAHFTAIIGGNGYNIQALLNESNGIIGYNIIDFKDKLPENIAKKVKLLENVIRVRCINF